MMARRGPIVIALQVHVDGDGAFPEMDEATPSGLLERIAALPDGMASGEPSVGLLVRMDDGKCVLGQTSLRCLLSASAMFLAHYTQDGQPKPPPPGPDGTSCH